MHAFVDIIVVRVFIQDYILGMEDPVQRSEGACPHAGGAS